MKQKNGNFKLMKNPKGGYKPHKGASLKTLQYKIHSK